MSAANIRTHTVADLDYEIYITPWQLNHSQNNNLYLLFYDFRNNSAMCVI